jgi:hypothetical protein
VSWLHLARDPSVLSQGSMFEAPVPLWVEDAVEPVAPRD